MKTQIPIKYRIAPAGNYNPIVHFCHKCCRFEATDYSIVYHIIGFFEVLGETMMVWECPRCFNKWCYLIYSNQGPGGLNYLHAYDAYVHGNKEWRKAALDPNYKLIEK